MQDRSLAVEFRDGRPLRDFRTTWRNLCAKANLPDLLVHDLRRSGARQLRKTGTAESVIMEIAGWETASMFRRYDITSNKDTAIAIEKLELQRAENKRQIEQERAENSRKNSRTFASEPQNAVNPRDEVIQ